MILLDAKCANGGRLDESDKRLRKRSTLQQSSRLKYGARRLCWRCSLSYSFFLKTYENELDGFMNY